LINRVQIPVNNEGRRKPAFLLFTMFERALLDQLDLGPESEVEIRIEGDALVITAHRPATNEQFGRAANRVFATRMRLLNGLAK
jgi:hypothetical protein